MNTNLINARLWKSEDFITAIIYLKTHANKYAVMGIRLNDYTNSYTLRVANDQIIFA